MTTNLISDVAIKRVDRVISAWALSAPDRPALIDDRFCWTFGILDQAIASAIRVLNELHVRPGDRVVIVNDNAPPAVAFYLAVLRLEAWPVLVNARVSPDELGTIATHAAPLVTLFVTGGSVHAALHAKRAGVTPREIDDLGDIGATPPDRSSRAEPVSGNPGHDVAALVYTSGSTGAPKGVMLTHENLLFIARVTGAIRHLTPADCFFGVLPISHIVGLAVVVLGSLMAGASVRMVGRFNPATLLNLFDADAISVMLSAPSLYALTGDYARARDIGRIAAPRLRMIGTCGAPLDPATKRNAEALFGLTLHNGYGTTECAPTIAQTRPEAPRTDCHVGPLLPGMEARLVDPAGNSVPEGETGLLHLRGPNVMKGYYRAPEATAAVLAPDGWLKTNDLARFEDGALVIVGRNDDLIIRSGHNVTPAAIEAVLIAHPAVAQAVVVGQTVAGNEDILAYIRIAEAETVTDAELAAHAARHLSLYQRPLHYIRLSAMPLAPNGKVLKSALPPFVPQHRASAVMG